MKLKSNGWRAMIRSSISHQQHQMEKKMHETHTCGQPIEQRFPSKVATKLISNKQTKRLSHSSKPLKSLKNNYRYLQKFRLVAPNVSQSQLRLRYQCFNRKRFNGTSDRARRMPKGGGGESTLPCFWKLNYPHPLPFLLPPPPPPSNTLPLSAP